MQFPGGGDFDERKARRQFRLTIEKRTYFKLECGCN